MNAMFDELMHDAEQVTDAEMHKENSEAVQSVLSSDPVAEQKKQIREAIAVNARKLRDLDEPRSLAMPAEVSKFARSGK